MMNLTANPTTASLHSSLISIICLYGKVWATCMNQYKILITERNLCGINPEGSEE